MFKKIILGAALLFSLNAFAQNNPAGDAEKTMPKRAERIALANQLVKYGYESQSALPLIQAVQIYQELGLTPATDGITPTQEEVGEASTTVTKTERPARTEEQLLADATKFADGDKTLLALVNNCKSATRGAVGGSIYRHDCVRGNATDVWRFRFRGGETAYVVVSGDGDTDLDLYVYDENGNLITQDIDLTDQCVVAFTPRWTGYFTIKIKNRGSIMNCYDLATN